MFALFHSLLCTPRILGEQLDAPSCSLGHPCARDGAAPPGVRTRRAYMSSTCQATSFLGTRETVFLAGQAVGAARHISHRASGLWAPTSRYVTAP